MQIRELPRGGQLSIHENIVNVPSDVNLTVHCLPRPINESQTIPIKLKRRLIYKHHYQFQNVRPKKVLDAAKYLVDTSDLFKREGIEVQNAWLDNISLQSSAHEDWSEFVENSDTSSNNELHTQTDKVVLEDKRQDYQKSISNADDENPGCEKEDSVDWCEVDERPSGVTDTLLQEPDVVENVDRIISFAPGEGNRPLGIFMDKDSEYLSFPTIFCGKRRPANNERKVPVSYSTICKWELRCQDRRVAMSVPNIFYKLKKLRSVVESVVCDPWNVKNFNQSRQAEQRQQDVRSPASIPSVIYANIRSVNNKIDELQAFVSVNDPSIVCLSETWLNSKIPNSACDVTDFTCYGNDRQTTASGGVCAYVKNMHPCERLQDFEEIEVESIWLKIRPHRLPRGTSSLLVAALHLPPSGSVEQVSKLIAHLQKNTENYLQRHPEGMLIITGDFNPTSTRIKSSDIIMATGLRQIVTVPTRNDSILDWCFTNKPNLPSKPVQLPKIGCVDHNALLIKPLNSNQFSNLRTKSQILRDTRASL